MNKPSAIAGQEGARRGLRAAAESRLGGDGLDDEIERRLGNETPSVGASPQEGSHLGCARLLRARSGSPPPSRRVHLDSRA